MHTSTRLSREKFRGRTCQQCQPSGVHAAGGDSSNSYYHIHEAAARPDIMAPPLHPIHPWYYNSIVDTLTLILLPIEPRWVAVIIYAFS